jgi:molecular chaperone IbpA
VKVVGAQLTDGLLHIELKREIPEAKKPRQISIVAGSQPVTIENARAA